MMIFLSKFNKIMDFNKSVDFNKTLARNYDYCSCFDIIQII